MTEKEDMFSFQIHGLPSGKAMTGEEIEEMLLRKLDETDGFVNNNLGFCLNKLGRVTEKEAAGGRGKVVDTVCRLMLQDVFTFRAPDRY